MKLSLAIIKKSKEVKAFTTKFYWGIMIQLGNLIGYLSTCSMQGWFEGEKFHRPLK